MTDKWIARIEAKLDALLEKAGIKPTDVVPATPPPGQARKLSEAEKQAIANAPAAPATVPPATNGPRVTAASAPATASSVPKATKK